MRTDIARLMREQNIDALVIDGPDGLGEANSPFNYFIGGAHVTSGRVVVTPEGATLFHGAMERDEAAKTGLACVDIGRYNMPELLKKHAGDRVGANVEMLRRQLETAGAGPRVAFYGAVHQNQSWAFLNRVMREEVCEIVADAENDVLSRARETKDEVEIARIRAACRLTENVVASTRDFLAGHDARGEALVQPDGSPLTVGDVKRFIRLRMVIEGLEPNEFIFSIGRDAGVAHSTGNPADPITLGRTIVFDIFPRTPGGYHADITRAWCLGYAPDHVLEAYEHVMEVHDACAAALDTRRPTSDYQELACDIFERHGHPTIRQHGPGLTRGYYHSLGHGIGLSVHEAPGMRNKVYAMPDVLKPGSVITIEPGLYYPDDPRGGWGLRVEDNYWCNPDTLAFECLTHLDRSLIVEMG